VSKADVPEEFYDFFEAQTRCTREVHGEMYDKYLSEFLDRCLGSTFSLPILATAKLPPATVTWMPGQHGYTPQGFGPLGGSSEIMVVSKMPEVTDVPVGRYLSDDRGMLLVNELDRGDVNPNDCYFTGAIKFANPFVGLTTIPAIWFKICKWALFREIELLQPKHILLLGSDSLKALFGKKATVKQYHGQVVDFGGAKVVVSNSPNDVARSPENMPVFQSRTALFCRSVRGVAEVHDVTEFKVVDTQATLEEMESDLLRYTAFSIDCEWRGSDYDSGKLLTVQICPRVGFAYVVRLRSFVSNFEFKPSISIAIAALRRVLARPEVQIYAHNGRADLKWLQNLGVDLVHQFAYRGFDTMLASHLLAENEEHNLTACTIRETNLGRYDKDVEDLLATGLEHWQLPDEVLYAYGAGDVNATYQLAIKYHERLWRQHVEVCERLGWNPNEGAACLPHKVQDGRLYPNSLYNLFRHIVMPVGSGIHEMEMMGLLMDEPLLKHMIDVFDVKRDEMLEDLRVMVQDPTFNPDSTTQVRKFLFGDPAGTDEEGNACTSLGLQPVKASGKRGKYWPDLLAEGKVWWEDDKGWLGGTIQPATDSESLGILADDGCIEAEMLRSYRFVNQICKNFLRGEEYDEDTGESTYQKGFMGMMASDGRVHTSISQLTETGRWRSARPNCFPEEVELLTDQGWVSVKDVVEQRGTPVTQLNTGPKRSLRVAQFNTKTKEVSFATPTGYVKSRDRLVRVKTKQFIDILCTPDHRCFVENLSGVPREVPAECYPKGKFVQPQAGSYAGGTVHLADWQVVLIAAFQADAHVMTGGQIDWGFTKQRKAARLRAALDAAGVQYRYSVGAKGRLRVYVPKQPAIDWLREWRHFGPQLLDLDAESFRKLEEEVYYWDGNHATRSSYSSSIKSNADWVQILGILSGRRCKLRLYQGHGERKDNWQVDATDVGHSRVSNRTVEQLDKEVDVYCVSMPEDTCIIRYNGRVAFIYNCQNLPKAREGSLKKIFKGVIPSIRSVVRAPDRHVLIEIDYESAEFWVLQTVGPDGKRLSLHTVNAVNIFNLPVSPVEFEDIRKDKSHKEAALYNQLRVAAKAVGFGIPYCRGARAIARQVSAEGIPCDQDTAQGYIDGFFKSYPQVARFLDFCKESVFNPRYIRTPYGRMRRFFPIGDDRRLATNAAQQREACNFPIQSTVADSLSFAVRLAQEERNRRQMKSRMLLAVHDAMLWEAPYEEAAELLGMLKDVMENTYVPSIGLHFYAEAEVFSCWGTQLDEETEKLCGLSA
jgi:uracil-DNA glycosylase family 4